MGDAEMTERAFWYAQDTPLNRLFIREQLWIQAFSAMAFWTAVSVHYAYLDTGSNATVSACNLWGA